MKYYVFHDKATLKLDESIQLSAIVIPAVVNQFEEVSIARYYKIKAQDSYAKASVKTKACYAATKAKAINIKISCCHLLRTTVDLFVRPTWCNINHRINNHQSPDRKGAGQRSNVIRYDE